MNKNLFFFATLSSLTLFFAYYSGVILETNQLVINSLSEKLTNQQINKHLSFQQKWEWLSYILIPFLLFFKIVLIAAIIDLGCFFFNREIKYKKLFNIVLKAEFIFLLVIIFKTLWFYFFQTNYELEDLQYFYPFSVLNVTGYEGLKIWWIYPLQVLNLFELAYWFILAYLLGKELKIKTDKGFSIIACSYGIALLIWIIAIMFFTLNMS
ncbi:hypothetical protein [uncultured Winogradskyella sp.]|uniref:hypothetical protein n=1 Tax=uncultured Winogradskyella sp. TaxID=395353 RepID=UPI0026040F56|nr:hypothetical protein [uncultured Winogradskyella sp.]